MFSKYEIYVDVFLIIYYFAFAHKFVKIPNSFIYIINCYQRMCNYDYNKLHVTRY